MSRFPGWAFRTTIEETIRLRIKDIKPLLHDRASEITLTWTSNRRMESFEVKIRWNNDGGIQISHKAADWPVPFQTDVRMTMTRANLGNGKGHRYWFQCPGLSNEQRCGKRVGVLCLPGGAAYFACRHCYRLPYQDQLMRLKQFDGLARLHSI